MAIPRHLNYTCLVLRWLAFALIAMPNLEAAPPSPQAKQIAARAIAHNSIAIEDRTYLVAGSHQFKTLWARDFAFAIPGALIAGHRSVVLDSLNLLFDHQRADGLLPRGMDNHSIYKRVIYAMIGMPASFRAPLHPWFETEDGVIAIDTNAILPWAAGEYVLRTRDLDFARARFPAAESAIEFLRKNYMKDGLVAGQPPYSDWEDSVERRGRVGFTNVMYVLTLQNLSRWARVIGDEAKSQTYADLADRTRKKFIASFWMPKVGVLRNFDGDDHLSADVNLIAIARGVVRGPMAKRILKTLKASPLWKPMPGRPTWPSYDDAMKDNTEKLVGIAGYHDEMLWLWITGMAVMAEQAVGQCEEAQALLTRLTQQIEKDGTVFEVFDVVDGDRRLVPVKRRFYQSEHPFTWSAAVYLEASQRKCDATLAR